MTDDFGNMDYFSALITVTVNDEFVAKSNTRFTRFPMRSRVSSASISDHSFIFIVCSDPNPFEIHTVFHSESPMVQPNPH